MQVDIKKVANVVNKGSNIIWILHRLNISDIYLEIMQGLKWKKILIVNNFSEDFITEENAEKWKKVIDNNDIKITSAFDIEDIKNNAIYNDYDIIFIDNVNLITDNKSEHIDNMTIFFFNIMRKLKEISIKKGITFVLWHWGSRLVYNKEKGNNPYSNTYYSYYKLEMEHLQFANTFENFENYVFSVLNENYYNEDKEDVNQYFLIHTLMERVRGK